MTDPAGRRHLLRMTTAIGLTVAAVVFAGGALPAEAQSRTTAVRGTVTVNGAPVAGVAVGTWAEGRGVLATATTDADGRFSLRSPSGVAVEAFAGVKPSAQKAVFALGDDRLVRGVIGAAAPTGTADALYTSVRQTVPSRLGGGSALHFRLQRAGRFTIPAPIAGGTGKVALIRGHGLYGPWSGPVDGATTSGWLVPGRYHVYWDPAVGSLPARTWVTVSPGTTAVVQPPAFTTPAFAPSATVTLHVTSGGKPVGADVPIVEETADGTNRVPSTDASGTSTVRELAPGTHTFRVGKAFVDPDEGSDGPPTSDDYLVKSVLVVIRDGQTTASATVDLEPAAKIAGTTAVNAGTYTAVYAQNAAGDIVRTASGDPVTGAFTLGGLPAGAYTVTAENRDTLVYDRVAVTATAGTTVTAPRPLKPGVPDLLVQGTVRGATSGEASLQSVTGSGSFVVTGVIRKSGAYHVRVVPGRYRAVVETQNTVRRVSGRVTVTASRTLQLVAGVRLAAARGRIVVNGHPVTVDLQATGPASIGLTPTNAVGTVTVTHAPPGTYRWTRSLRPLPARDGPWFYGIPKGRFTLKAGQTLDLGTKSVSVKG